MRSTQIPTIIAALVLCILLAGIAYAADNNNLQPDTQTPFQWQGSDITKVTGKIKSVNDLLPGDLVNPTRGMISPERTLQTYNYSNMIYNDEAYADRGFNEGMPQNTMTSLGLGTLGVGILPIAAYGGSFQGATAGVMATSRYQDTFGYVGHKDAALKGVSINPSKPGLQVQGDAQITGNTVSGALATGNLVVTGGTYEKRIYGTSQGQLLIYGDKLRYNGQMGDGDADLILTYSNKDTQQPLNSWVMGRDDVSTDKRGLWLVAGDGDAVYVRAKDELNSDGREAVLDVGGAIELSNANNPNTDTTPIKMFQSDEGDFVIRLG